MKPSYDCLFGLNCVDLRKKDIQLKLEELTKYMEGYYDAIRINVRECDSKIKLSSTLITKILMGTLGCVPAYDRYFIDGIKDQKVSSGNYGLKSLLNLVDFYELNIDRLEDVRKNLKVYDLQYPQMKLLDMGFWQIGFEKDPNNEKKTVH